MGHSFEDGWWRGTRDPVEGLRPLSANTLDDDEFRRLADSQPTLCWIANGDGYVVWFNSASYRYCGTTPETMEGWGWASVHDPETLPAVRDTWLASIASGETFEMVFPLRGADGIFRPFLTRVVPLLDRAGMPVRWFGNHVDITAQRRVETALRDSEQRLKALNDTLEARVVERTEGLRQAEDQLRQAQKLEAIGQLTGGVAHDFNNVLTVIQGSIELLQRPNISEEKRTRHISVIAEVAERATKMTGQLLAFSRRQILTPELFDVGLSLRRLEGMMATITGSGIVVVLNIESGRHIVSADRSQFDTAIVNMVINARDAMRGHGRIVINVSITSEPPNSVTLGLAAGELVTVSISDTGVGIPEDDVQTIFEPFFTTKSAGSGTGLGLSQVIGFAKQSDGDVQVVSVLDVGSTFTLYLPRRHGDIAERMPDIPSSMERDGDGACVLVVEDNVEVGRFAASALEELGYSAVVVSDGDQALALLSKGHTRCDIVFSDVVMPGTNGIELAAELKRIYPHLPLVLTSGYSLDLAQKGKNGVELISKPYSMKQLGQVMRRALGSSRIDTLKTRPDRS